MAAVLVHHHASAQRAFCIERAAGVELHAVAVPRTRPGRGGHRGVGLSALAHEVDGASGAAGALKQARRAPQDFEPVVEHHAFGAPVAQRVVVARNGDTVVLPVVDLEAPCRQHHALPHAADALGASDVVDGVFQIGDALLVQLLAREHADGLRNVLERLVALVEADRACSERVRSLGGRAARRLRGGGDRRQRRFRRSGVCRRGAAQREGAPGAARHLEARAGQQVRETVAHAEAAIEATRGLALHQGRRHGDAHARGGREVAQCFAERAGRDAVDPLCLRGHDGGGSGLRRCAGRSEAHGQHGGMNGQRQRAGRRGMTNESGRSTAGHEDSLCKTVKWVFLKASHARERKGTRCGEFFFDAPRRIGRGRLQAPGAVTVTQ